jgi:hypothetical protein
MQTLDFAKFGKSIKKVIFLDLFMEICDNKDPALHGLITRRLHLMGRDD